MAVETSRHAIGV